MKLTTQKLKRLIREELAKINEAFGPKGNLSENNKMKPLQSSENLDGYAFGYGPSGEMQNYIIKKVPGGHHGYDFYDVYIEGREYEGAVFKFKDADGEMYEILQSMITKGIDKYLAKKK